jgi:hypothetical protein
MNIRNRIKGQLECTNAMEIIDVDDVQYLSDKVDELETYLKVAIEALEQYKDVTAAIDKYGGHWVARDALTKIQAIAGAQDES